MLKYFWNMGYGLRGVSSFRVGCLDAWGEISFLGSATGCQRAVLASSNPLASEMWFRKAEDEA